MTRITGGFDMHATVMRHKREYLYVEYTGRGKGGFYGHVVSSRVSRFPVGPETYAWNDADFVVADCYVPPYSSESEMYAALVQLAEALDVPLFPVDTHFERLLRYAKEVRRLHKVMITEIEEIHYPS